MSLLNDLAGLGGAVGAGDDHDVQATEWLVAGHALHVDVLHAGYIAHVDVLDSSDSATLSMWWKFLRGTFRKIQQGPSCEPLWGSMLGRVQMPFGHRPPHFVRLWLLNLPEHFVVARSCHRNRVFDPPSVFDANAWNAICFMKIHCQYNSVNRFD